MSIDGSPWNTFSRYSLIDRAMTQEDKRIMRVMNRLVNVKNKYFSIDYYVLIDIIIKFQEIFQLLPGVVDQKVNIVAILTVTQVVKIPLSNILRERQIADQNTVFESFRPCNGSFK